MRIYTSYLEMVREVERDLYEMGTEYSSATVQDKKLSGEEALTLELNGYSYMVKPSSDLQEGMDYMKCDMLWASAEMRERIKGHINPGSAYKIRKDFWNKFLRDGFFSYTYPERLNWQIAYIVNELRRRPNTRQAIMGMYSPERDIMNFGGRDRIPCTISYQFLYRDGKLNVIYNQRSCDFLKFFMYDVFFACRLRDHIANQCNMEKGDFTHFLGSLHAFKIDMKERGIF